MATGNFNCELCPNVYVSKRSVKRHMSEHIVEHECKHCGKIFIGKKNFKEHNLLHKEHKTHECPTCGKVLKSKNSLKIHGKLHYGIVSEKLKCNLCPKDLADRRALTSHLRSHKRSDPCEFCGKNFTQQASLRKHIRNIHENIRYSCKICTYQAKDKNALRIHTKTQFRKHSL